MGEQSHFIDKEPLSRLDDKELLAARAQLDLMMLIGKDLDATSTSPCGNFEVSCRYLKRRQPENFMVVIRGFGSKFSDNFRFTFAPAFLAELTGTEDSTATEWQRRRAPYHTEYQRCLEYYASQLMPQLKEIRDMMALENKTPGYQQQEAIEAMAQQVASFSIEYTTEPSAPPLAS